MILLADSKCPDRTAQAEIGGPRCPHMHDHNENKPIQIYWKF